MRVFLGMILGAFLTVGAAFIHDSWTAAPATTGAAGNMVEQRAMVNWDVVGENWRVVQRRARDAWSSLSQKITS